MKFQQRARSKVYKVYALKLVIMSTISAPMRFCASTVAAPMCGVQETIGWL